MNVAFMLKVYIHHCYPSVIGIWKNSMIKAKMLKSEGLVRKHITYIQHIKIQWCHMGFIFMPKHQIRQILKCEHILSLIMHFHTGNVFYSYVLNVLVSIFLTKKQPKQNDETTTSIRFHIYHIIGHCTSLGRISWKDKKIYSMC